MDANDDQTPPAVTPTPPAPAVPQEVSALAASSAAAPSSAVPASPSLQTQSPSSMTRQCNQCAFLNYACLLNCEMCGALLPPPAPALDNAEATPTAPRLARKTHAQKTHAQDTIQPESHSLDEGDPDEDDMESDNIRPPVPEARLLNLAATRDDVLEDIRTTLPQLLPSDPEVAQLIQEARMNTHRPVYPDFDAGHPTSWPSTNLDEWWAEKV